MDLGPLANNTNNISVTDIKMGNKQTKTSHEQSFIGDTL
jgi:hypothetical protein